MKRYHTLRCHPDLNLALSKADPVRILESPVVLDTRWEGVCSIFGDVNARTERTAMVLTICSLMEGREYQVPTKVRYRGEMEGQ